MGFLSQYHHRTAIPHAAQFRFAALFASPPYETRGSAARMAQTDLPGPNTSMPTLVIRDAQPGVLIVPIA